MLLRAMLLQAFYSIRSERQLMERLEFDLLFRWFVGLGIDDPVWDHSVFSKNRDRLLDGEIAAKFLTAVLAQPVDKQSGTHPDAPEYSTQVVPIAVPIATPDGRGQAQPVTGETVTASGGDR
jgi:hypothetical protein